MEDLNIDMREHMYLRTSIGNVIAAFRTQYADADRNVILNAIAMAQSYQQLVDHPDHVKNRFEIRIEASRFWAIAQDAIIRARKVYPAPSLS